MDLQHWSLVKLQQWCQHNLLDASGGPERLEARILAAIPVGARLSLYLRSSRDWREGTVIEHLPPDQFRVEYASGSQGVHHLDGLFKIYEHDGLEYEGQGERDVLSSKGLKAGSVILVQIGDLVESKNKRWCYVKLDRRLKGQADRQGRQLYKLRFPAGVDDFPDLWGLSSKDFEFSAFDDITASFISSSEVKLYQQDEFLYLGAWQTDEYSGEPEEGQQQQEEEEEEEEGEEEDLDGWWEEVHWNGVHGYWQPEEEEDARKWLRSKPQKTEEERLAERVKREAERVTWADLLSDGPVGPAAENKAGNASPRSEYWWKSAAPGQQRQHSLGQEAGPAEQEDSIQRQTDFVQLGSVWEDWEEPQPAAPKLRPSSASAALLADRAAATAAAKLEQAAQAFAAADREAPASMLVPLQRLLMALVSKAAPALREVVSGWGNFSMARQQEVFDAALIVAGQGNWGQLEQQLRLALDMTAGW